MIRLFQKMFRDIWKHKVQFFSVFCMAFLGILIYSGIEGVWLGMDNMSNKFYKDTNAASMWIIGRDLTEADLLKVKQLKYVEEAMLTTQINVESNYMEKKQKKSSNLQVNTFNDIDNFKLYYKLGEKANITDTDSCWLDFNYANQHNLKVEDTIVIKYAGIEKRLTIKGIVISPEYISYTGSKTTIMPNHEKYGYLYMNEKTFESFIGKVPYNRIKLNIDGIVENVNDDMIDILDNRFIMYYDRDNYTGVSAFTSQINQLKGMSILFSAMFILLTLLSMQSTMKRLIETQRTQIGTLKAIGFTNFQILLHFSLYGFIVSVIGSILGFVLAPKIITPALLKVQKDFYTLPKWDSQNSIISYIIMIITILSCTFITISACHSSIKLVPAEAMREKTITTKKIKEGTLLKYLSFEWKWSVRFLLRNKMRTFIGVVGVAGCIMLMMASLGLNDSLYYANKYLYGVQYNYKNKIVFDQIATQEDKDSMYKKAGVDSQKIQESIIEIKTRNDYYPSTITVIDEGYYVNFYNNVKTRDKQIILDKDTVVITRNLAKILNVKKGETIKLKVAGDTEYKTFIISDIVYLPAPQGIVVSKSCWEAKGYVFNESSLLTGKSEMLQFSKDKEYVSEFITLDEQLDNANEVLNSAITIVVLLIAAGVILSVIIVFNLGILNFTERTREYSTLKVLGFDDSEIKSILMKDTFITNLLALIIGIPCGFVFLRVYVTMLSTSLFDYYTYMKWTSLLIAVIVALGCSYIVNHVVISKIKNIDMVEALKSE